MTIRAKFEHRGALLRSALEEFSERGYDPDSAFGSLIARCHAEGQFQSELSLAFVRGGLAPR